MGKMVFVDSCVQIVVKIVIASVMFNLKRFGKGLPVKQQGSMLDSMLIAAKNDKELARASIIENKLLPLVHKKLDDKKFKMPKLVTFLENEMNRHLPGNKSSIPEISTAKNDEGDADAGETPPMASPEDIMAMERLKADIQLDVKLRRAVNARAEFDVAAQIIDLMYKQALILSGSVYSPSLPILGCLNMFVSFFVTKKHVMWFGKNSAANTGAGNTDRFNFTLLFCTVLITLYCAIQFMSESHIRCGPFVRVDGHRYQVFGMYFTAGYLPKETTDFVSTLLHPSVLMALCLLTGIELYFKDCSSDKEARNLRSVLDMLSEENREKKHIILTNNINLDEASDTPIDWE